MKTTKTAEVKELELKDLINGYTKEEQARIQEEMARMMWEE
jgi:hypothetical protein